MCINYFSFTLLAKFKVYKYELWNYKHIKIAGKSVYFRYLSDLGINYVKHLIDNKGKFKASNVLMIPQSNKASNVLMIPQSSKASNVLMIPQSNKASNVLMIPQSNKASNVLMIPQSKVLYWLMLKHSIKKEWIQKIKNETTAPVTPERMYLPLKGNGDHSEV